MQGLRSIFRILRARKLAFTNPTLRIHVPAQAMIVPPAAGLAALRDALDSPSPARAVISVLAYHAIPVRQLAPQACDRGRLNSLIPDHLSSGSRQPAPRMDMFHCLV